MLLFIVHAFVIVLTVHGGSGQELSGSNLADSRFSLSDAAGIGGCEVDENCTADSANTALLILLLFGLPDKVPPALAKYGIDATGFDPLVIADVPQLDRGNVGVKLRNVTVTGMSSILVKQISFASTNSTISVGLTKFSITGNLQLRYRFVTYRRDFKFSIDAPLATVTIVSTTGYDFSLRDIILDLALDTSTLDWSI